jgi:hypothetical protein
MKCWELSLAIHSEQCLAIHLEQCLVKDWELGLEIN